MSKKYMIISVIVATMVPSYLTANVQPTTLIDSTTMPYGVPSPSDFTPSNSPSAGTSSPLSKVYNRIWYGIAMPQTLQWYDKLGNYHSLVWTNDSTYLLDTIKLANGDSTTRSIFSHLFKEYSIDAKQGNLWSQEYLNKKELETRIPLVTGNIISLINNLQKFPQAQLDSDNPATNFIKNDIASIKKDITKITSLSGQTTQQVTEKCIQNIQKLLAFIEPQLNT